jgi:hypothetical protein
VSGVEGLAVILVCAFALLTINGVRRRQAKHPSAAMTAYDRELERRGWFKRG